jgi:hypothetical protein
MTDRELDYAVARRVMGWTLYNYETDEPATAEQWDKAQSNDGWSWDFREGDREAYEWCPSTDIACAWEVVKRIRDVKKQSVLIEESLNPIESICSVGIHHRGQWIEVCRAVAENAPRAICEAALLCMAK